MRVIIFFFILIISLQGCVEPINDTFTKLPPGVWRGRLIINDPTKVMDEDEEFMYVDNIAGEIPFNFNVVYDSEDEFHIEIQNADETIVVDSIVYGRDKKTAKDTIHLYFPSYQTHIEAVYEDYLIQGHWVVDYKENYRIPFKAVHGQNHRFTTDKVEPFTDITGKWDVTFVNSDGSTTEAIGEFQQEHTHLTGTFMTNTGDYRFLEGDVIGDKFYLSTFDGTFAYLFEGKLVNQDSILGGFKSGKHYTSTWSAVRNDTATLKDPYAMTNILNPDEPFSFTMKDLDGNTVTLDDDRFRDKIKLIKISGTWCPNCKDEADFLKEYLSDHPSDEYVVIELNFERHADDAKNINHLKTYVQHEDIPYVVLYGGQAKSSVTKEKLPQLEKVLSYPTLLFVDRNNIIQKVHTGFAGPATSGYEKFTKDFHDILSSLLETE